MTMQYVSPTEEQKETMQSFRDQYESLYLNVKSLLTPDEKENRGLKLSLVKLEESAFWLNKSITNND